MAVTNRRPLAFNRAVPKNAAALLFQATLAMGLGQVSVEGTSSSGAPDGA